VPGGVCDSRPCGRTAWGFAVRAADADRVGLACGIGPVTARAVCARFHSLHELLTADAATLATVPGVSPARAAALEQLLRAALPTSDYSSAGEA
jgi:ERCC4-type nuclease